MTGFEAVRMAGHGGTLGALRSAAERFRIFVSSWPADTQAERGLTRDDADLVAGHIDRVLLFSGPGIPPIGPEDEVAVEAAYRDFATFVATWPADRVDPASGLTRRDLDLIAAERGPVRPHPPEHPFDVIK